MPEGLILPIPWILEVGLMCTGFTFLIWAINFREEN